MERFITEENSPESEFSFLLACISCTKLFKVILPKMQTIFLNQPHPMHTFLSTPPILLQKISKGTMNLN
jgi:hypothetical protein